MLARIFEKQVLKYAQNTAIKTADRQLTYSSLNTYANGVAQEILNITKECLPDKTIANVALLFEHSIDMIVSTLGALKSGRIYIPFDPTYPAKRLSYMLKDSEAKILLTNSKNVDLAMKLSSESDESVIVLNIDNIDFSEEVANLNLDIDDNDIAYILYTSGSTGTPKGVFQSHKNIFHFISCYSKTMEISSQDRMTLFSAFSHDAAIMDIYSALLNGAALYPLNIKEQGSFNELSTWLQREQITIWHSVPTLYRYFINALKEKENFSTLRYIVLGGETVIEHDVEMFKKLFPNTKLVNLYGQTESSFNSAQIFSALSIDNKITLGEPVEDTELLVIDEDRNEVSPLEEGEIVVLSDYIAYGYWKDEEKTKSVFQYNENVGKLYWTGDLGRLLPDGTIKFIGRKGSVVKVRGYRVDTGEVESQILKYENIKEAVVLAKKDESESDDFLCAYIVADKKLDVQDLKEYMSEYLPNYMMPAYFLQIEKMPLTPNGKTDKRALRQFEEYMYSEIEYEAPRNEIEEQLVTIWSEILEVDKIGVNYNFFELGGHSLKATMLVSRCFAEFGVEIPLGEIFRNPTIKGLGEYISSHKSENIEYIQPVGEREYYPVSSSQRRMYILNQMNPDNTNYNMPMIFKVKGNLNTDRVEKAMLELVKRHESLRTSFHIEEGESVQRIAAEPAVNIKYSASEGKDTDELIKSFIKPFNLAISPLVRLEVVTLCEDSYLLMFDIHHIVSDGYSTGILIKEFMELYEGKEQPELKLQYKDYSVWENKLTQSDEMKKQEEYWRNLFKKEPVKLNMPLDFKRRSYQTFNGDRLKFKIIKNKIERLEAVGQKQGATLNMVLYSIFNILLHKYSGQEDITTGMIMSGRRHPYLEKVIGVFINFLPIRSIINPESTFLEFLDMEKAVITDAYDNEYYPFDKIVEKLVKEQDKGRNPIFDSMFILHNEFDTSKQYDLEGIEIKGIDIKRYTSKLDFQMDALVDSEGNLSCTLEYNTNLFKEATMKDFIKHFEMLIDRIADNSEVIISNLNVFEDYELQDIEKKRIKQHEDLVKLDIVITSTFTDEPVGEYIKWWCRKFKHDINVKFAPYNQVFQQLLNKESLVNRNNGINVILVRFEDWIRDAEVSETRKCSIMEENYKDMIAALKSKREESIYLFGILPTIEDANIGSEALQCIQKLKVKLEEDLKQIRNVFLINLSDLQKLYSISEVYDSYRDKLGHIPFTEEYYAAMGTTIARKICALRSSPFKVIVLDCDNTLWKGVCGEDGALGVKIGKEYEDLQAMLIQKYEEGMLLALCSKNNEKDVWEVFETNSGMLLKKEHLAAWRINWSSKSENIKELAKELNLGLDSFIFIDDSPVECSEVKLKLPEVLTLQLPIDSKAIPMFIRHIWAFDKVIVTKEDRARTQMYSAERERKSLQNKEITIEEFLKSLKLKMSMKFLQEEDMTRAYQMIHRTNQFNLSTIRRTEEELRSLVKSENIVSWVVEVQDRFGDYGIVGLVIAERRKDSLFLDTFLLSCRALGRGVEDAIVNGLADYCRNEKIKYIVADYFPTPKNKPILEFMEKGLWHKRLQSGDYAEYNINLDQFSLKVDYIDSYYDCSNKGIEKDTYKEIKAETKENLIKKNESPDNNLKTRNMDMLFSETESHWELKFSDKERYKEYLLALNNCTGKKLLQLPVSEENESEIMSDAEYEAPGSEIEERLISIWEEILKVSGIGINHNFFLMGGHSLKATSLVSKIHKEFDVEVPLHEIFRLGTVKEIAKFISNAESSKYSSIKPAEEKEYYSVSSAQRRMYMLQQFNLESVGYNEHGAIRIEGDLNISKLEQVFRELIRRHETLRTSFEIIETKIVQKVNSEVDFKLEYAESKEDEIKNVIGGFVRPFSLDKAPLFRAGVVKVSEKTHILMFDMHHIISDGTSMEILIYEFMKLYNNEKLEALKIQYKDYAQWQNSILKSEKMKLQENYWVSKFSGEIPVLNLKCDFTRPVIQSFEGDSLTFALNKEITDRMKAIAAETGSTMYMVILSVISILLSKYSGQEDIIVGSPIAGRNHVDLEKIIGVFVNTLAMRNNPAANKSYAEFIKDVKQTALEAYENQDYQFEELVDKLDIKRDMSRNPLFDVMFIMQNISSKIAEIEGLEFKRYEHGKKVSKVDLTFKAHEADEELLIEVEYSTRLFKKSTIERMRDHFTNIVRAVCKNTNVLLGEIDYISNVEKSKLLYEFNNTSSYYPKDQIVQEIFEAQVKKTPNNIALIYQEQKVTYDELNKRANSLARKLRDMGVNRDSIVGIQVERSIEMLVSILAVLKAGGAYLPLDPEYPEERVNYMLEDSEAEILLVTGNLKKNIDFHGQVLDLWEVGNYFNSGENLERINASSDLAYVIYTSGSTGKPKGVMIEHKQVNNFTEGIVKAVSLTLYKSILCLTTISFDIFVLETLVPLLKGLKVVIAQEKDQIDGEKLGKIISNNNIEVMQSTPSRVQLLMEKSEFINSLNYLKLIMVGGDIMPSMLLKQLKQHEKLKIFNMYGPTETTVWSTVKDLSDSEEVCIGKPIQNTKIYILNEYNKLQPIGDAGEICIAGEGVARGYFKRDELTKEKFVENPFTSGERIYKTGDLGAWMPDGNIEILGRMDNQVKVRGFRVELGEIENHLIEHEAVKEVVVIDKEDENGIKYLCCYVRAEREITAKELREHLAKNIPDYMIPSYFIQLEKMPLTPNGKIDRRALRQFEGYMDSGMEYEAPRNEIEEQLIIIWSEILEAEKIGVNYNFFELGGHSLKATLMASRCFKEFGVEIPLGEIFRNPTIKELGEYITSHKSGNMEYIQPVEEREYYPVSSSQRRMYILNQMNPDNTNYNMPMIFRAKGKLKTDRVESAMLALVKRHETLRTSFHMEEGEIVQRIAAEPMISIKYSAAEGKDINELIKTFIKPFNLALSPLVRLEIVTLCEDSYLLMFDIHHIVSDGYSTGILIKEFMELYEGKEQPELKLQYKDYSVWENNLVQLGEMKKQEEYWRNVFTEEPVKLNMPLDFKRPAYQTFNGDKLKFEILKEKVEKLEALGQKQGATLNMVLYSIFNILLHKYSGQEDITSGMIMSGRGYPYLESIIGVFINFLPIRNKVNPSLTFKEFLNAEKAVINAAYDNQRYPFDEIVAKVVKEQDSERNPLFDAMFILHNEYDVENQYKLEGMDIEGVEVNRNASKLDFQIDAIVDNVGNLKGVLEYNTNLFKDGTMKAFIKHFAMLIDRIADNSDIRISDLSVFEGSELQTIERKRRNTSELNVVISSTFTDEPLGDYIKWWCKKFKHDTSIKFAPYNQVFQQLLNEESLLNRNNGINVILVRFEDWIRDVKATGKEKCSIMERNYKDMIAALKSKREESIYLFGILVTIEDSSIGSEALQCIQKLKVKLEEDLKQIRNVFQLDLRDLQKLYSISEVYDPYRDKLGHIPFTEEYYAAMGTAIARKICALRSSPFKVIVLDCDNTLWKGVCGEDGALGVNISKEYNELQRMLLQKYEEGLLIALCSKNNEADVWEVFESNSGMLLKKEHFTAWRINWSSKAENIRELSEELNLGLDSFIFIDDSPVECSEVRLKLPEVLTIQLPMDSKAMSMFIRHIWAFDKVIVTKEDRARAQMYTAERERKNLQNNNITIEEYLKSLKLKMSMRFIKEEDMKRAYQMIHRTNQFNLSTIRRTEEELRTLIKSNNIVSWVIEVQDRFGDYGIVGLVIAEKQKDALFLDTFLLSCRALGRGIEAAIIKGLAEFCKDEKIKYIVADYYPTSKNKPILEFMEKGLWKKVNQSDDYIKFNIDVEEFDMKIDFIECFYNCSYVDDEEYINKDFMEESACSNSITESLEVEALPIDAEPYWEVIVSNEKNLKYNEYLLALSNYTGKKLLKLPINETIKAEALPLEAYEAPNSEIEERLIRIWEEILKTPGIGVNHNFFQLGGHSLKATSLVSKIHKEFNVEVPLHEIFRLATVREIAKYILNAENNKYNSIMSAEPKEYYVVSSAQRRMYMLQKFNPESVAYNEHGALRIEGDLDTSKLEQVFKELIRRHETLRTSFEIAETEIMQKINSEVDFKLEYAERNEHEIENFAADFVRPFNLNSAPLIRIALVKVKENAHVLMFDLHHIISDGVSMGILIKEFIQLYSGKSLKPLKLQYKDYAEWHNRSLLTEDMKKQEKYWLNKFSGDIPKLNLPTDYPRADIQQFDGDSISFFLDSNTITNLRKIANKTNSTIYMMFLTIYNILLHKYTDAQDIIVGSPIAGRLHEDLQGVIGVFINTLAMRNYIEKEKEFKEILLEVNKNTLEAYENQSYQFEDLVSKLRISADASQNPLFTTMFIVENMDVEKEQLEGLEFKPYQGLKRFSKVDMTLYAIQIPDGFAFKMEYCTKLFKKETIEEFIDSFIKISQILSQNPNIKIKDIMLIDIKKKAEIISKIRQMQENVTIDFDF